MAGRTTFPRPVLALLFLLVGVSHSAAAAEPVRFLPPAEPTARLSVQADEVFTWTDGNEQMHLLNGNVFINQGLNTITASRAILWTNAAAVKGKQAGPIAIYADAYETRQVRVEVSGQTPRVVSAALVEFANAPLGNIRGKVREESQAKKPFYQQANQARTTATAAEPAVKVLPPTAITPRNDAVSPAVFVRPPNAPSGFRTVQGTDDEPKLPPIGIKDPPGPPPSDPKLEPKQPPKGNPLDDIPDPKPVIGSTVIPLPLSQQRTIWIAPRTNRPWSAYPMTIGKENVFIVTGGVKIMVKFPSGNIRALSVEADQVVIWKQGDNPRGVFDEMGSPEGSSGGGGVEFYMAGNVVLRYGTETDVTATGVQQQAKTLRAERVYYDIDNHKAIAIHGDLEYTRLGLANTGHMSAQELWQLGDGEFVGMMAELHASRLPSDPGLKLTTPRAHIYKMPKSERRTIFGLPFRDRLTGSIVEEEPQMLEATDIVTRIRDVPVFWWPRIKTNLNDPFGPFMGVTFRQDRVFGAQVFATWDMLELIGVTPLQGEKWTLATDYLSARGPALGTQYELKSPTMFGMEAPFQTLVKGYMIDDAGTDILGGPRQDDFKPTHRRGRFLFRHQQDFGDLTLQTQLTYLSDRNFHESYMRFDYDMGPNQETFLWLKYQQGNAAATFLTQADLGRGWISETFWLPKVSGHLIGQSFFDRLTYHTWGSAAYARLDPYRQPEHEFPLTKDQGYPPPEKPWNGGRFDWMQRISMPFEAGPFKMVPYGTLDTALYTEDVNGSQRGRAVGGVGWKATLPFSRLYRDVQSDMLYLDGLYHKNEFNTNYYLASATSPYTLLPQLDRLNDDTIEQGWRDYTPWHAFVEPTKNMDGRMLTGSTIFNPRYYALRRLVDTKPDNLDSIHVVQFDWKQRLQTKRGYPGLEHTVDWLTLDLSASLFPTPNRDNFNNSVAFLEYNLNWNVGDRTGFYSSGWVDPYDFGARYWSIGTNFFRDDRTRFNLSYRMADPIQTRTVSASAYYVFSPKYSVTAVTAFDFGNQNALTNSLYFTRIGTDMQVTFGVSYNAIINNFGVTLSIVPNLIANRMGQPGTGGSAFGGNTNQDRR